MKETDLAWAAGIAEMANAVSAVSEKKESGLMDAITSFKSKDDTVRVDIVKVEDLPEYLLSLPGREKHQYVPHQWETETNANIAATRVTHYLVLTWKGR